MKKTFISVMEKVAKPYPHSISEETKLINKFKTDISTLKGDPVFFDK